MNDRNNTIAGWVLFAGIVALGSSLVAGQVFKSERPETMGYPIAGVEAEDAGGGEAEQPIEFYLASADVAKGEQVFKRCVACHTIDQGGPNGLGPNLYNNMFAKVAHVPGFAYSPALAGHGGIWDWQTMSEWLKNPKAFAPGTKMTFAGLSNPEDRANVMAYLNTKSAAPRPLPAAPVASTPGAAGDKAASEADDAGAQKAENEPVLNEQQAVKGGNANLRGEAAPAVSAPGTTVPEKQ